MKLTTPLAAIVVLGATAISGLAQGRGISGNGFDSGSIGVKPKDTVKKTTKTVKTIQFVAVSEERMWKSADKKKKPIRGSLLAFAREKKTGKVSIVENESVRLLVGKKDFTLPLTKLSADDQAYIHKLVDAARIAGKLIEPKPAKEKDKDAKAKKPEKSSKKVPKQSEYEKIVVGMDIAEVEKLLGPPNSSTEDLTGFLKLWHLEDRHTIAVNIDEDGKVVLKSRGVNPP